MLTLNSQPMRHKMASPKALSGAFPSALPSSQREKSHQKARQRVLGASVVATLSLGVVSPAAHAQSVAFYNTANRPISSWRAGQTFLVKFSGGYGTQLCAIWTQTGQANAWPQLIWRGAVSFPRGTVIRVRASSSTQAISITGGYANNYWPLNTLYRN